MARCDTTEASQVLIVCGDVLLTAIATQQLPRPAQQYQDLVDFENAANACGIDATTITTASRFLCALLDIQTGNTAKLLATFHHQDHPMAALTHLLNSIRSDPHSHVALQALAYTGISICPDHCLAGTPLGDSECLDPLYDTFRAHHARHAAWPSPPKPVKTRRQFNWPSATLSWSLAAVCVFAIGASVLHHCSHQVTTLIHYLDHSPPQPTTRHDQ